LHTLKKDKSEKNRKRVGRGNASGWGTYSGKGMKGQKARSGVSGLKRLGMKQVLMRIPKEKGFKSPGSKAQVVNISAINKHFKNNETVSPQSLYRKKLIETPKRRVKILGNGKLAREGLVFKDVEMSDSVKQQIKS